MERVIGEVATVAGYAARVLVVLLSWVPVVVGPLLVLYGTWMYSPPASYILAGLIVSALTLVRPNTKGAGRR